MTVKVDQLGGAFGRKFTRANLVACASAVASHNLNKTVRVALDFNTSTELVGRRGTFLAKYSVGFDSRGKIQSVNIEW